MPSQTTTMDTMAAGSDNYMPVVRLKQFAAQNRCTPLIAKENYSVDEAFGSLGGARLLLMLFAWVNQCAHLYILL